MIDRASDDDTFCPNQKLFLAIIANYKTKNYKQKQESTAYKRAFKFQELPQELSKISNQINEYDNKTSHTHFKALTQIS